MNKIIFYIILIPVLFINNIKSQENICNGTLEPTLLLKKIGNISVPYQNGFPLPSFEKQSNSTRTIINLGGLWKEFRFAADHNMTLMKRDNQTISKLANSPFTDIADINFDDNSGGWINKTIPSVEEKMNGNNPPEYYEQGGVWYRRHFTVGDITPKEKVYKLIFYSVNYVADVWLNGHYLGYHEGGYTPFAFDVTDKIDIAGDNVIAVRVDNPPQQSRSDIIPCNAISLWCHYTGIIHDVYLETSNPVSTIRADVKPIDTLGNANIKYVIRNNINQQKSVNVELKIYKAKINQNNIQSELASDLIEDAVNFEVAKKINITIQGSSVFAGSQSVKIPNPHLWFPDSPDLYILKISLIDNNEFIDEYYCQFGLRKLEVKGFRVYLNNKPVFLTGINRAEDHPVYGRSLPISVIYSDLVKIHELNCNWMRTDHYPNHLYTYLISDRLGIAVAEEIPLAWFEKYAWDCQEKRNIHKQMYREMVFKDFNRSSIFMWSLSNEGAYLSKRKNFIDWAINDKEENYEDGRLITQASGSGCPDNSQDTEMGTGLNDQSQNICDIAGYTNYQGEYNNKCEELYKGQYYSRTNSFLEDFHKNFNKPYVTFEFGSYAGKNRENLLVQKSNFLDKFRAFSGHAPFNKNMDFNCEGFVCAVTYWTAFDFWVSGKDQYQGYFGIFDMNRENPKPVYDALKEAYEPYFTAGGIYRKSVPECSK